MRTKQYKVVMLPTEKESDVNIWLNKNNQKPRIENYEPRIENFGWINQHLYLISDDEIKDYDWVYLSTDAVIGVFKVVNIDFDRNIHLQGETTSYQQSNLKKIVATTDTSITFDYSTPGELFTPTIPTSFIQAYIKAYNESKPIKEVDLEMQFTGMIDNFQTGLAIESIKTRPDNTVIVHQSKMYSKDEVIALCAKAWDESYDVNVRGKDRLTSDNNTREPVHFKKFIQDNL